MLTLAHAAYAASTEELLQRTGLHAGDVVRAQWGNNLVLPAHFLAVDRDSDTVVVSIRGTYGMVLHPRSRVTSSVLTALSCYGNLGWPNCFRLDGPDRRVILRSRAG